MVERREGSDIANECHIDFALVDSSAVSLSETANSIKGVFLVTTKNAFVPVKRDNSVNTYSRISTVPRGSERSE